MQKLVNFDWKIDATAEGGEPFRPSAFIPQTIRFRETDDRVDRCETREHDQVRIVQLRHRCDENLRIMLGRIELKVTDNFLRKLLVVAPQKTQQSEACKQHDRAFEC